jgi:uncharacterized protein (DUF2267 family)
MQNIFISRRRPQNRKRSGEDERPARTHRPLNFEKYASEGNHFVNLVASHLGCDRNTAARITRAVLHAVRDRLPPVDAVQFAQGLPMAMKGVFFDQYDISAAPVLIRHPDEFIDYVMEKAGPAARRDFPSPESVEHSVSAVFNVLEQTMDYGQVEQIRKMINDEIGYMMC